MRFLSRLAFITVCVGLSACSVWQSEGRKFLEKQAFEYTGAQAYLVQCVPASETAGWTLLASQHEASVFHLAEQTQLRVIPHAERAFSCDYRFSDSVQMREHLAPAIENTWAHYYKP